jgi:Ca-activated chloride channel family protein
MIAVGKYMAFAPFVAAILASEPAPAANDAHAPCTEDAMLVFDASGSMSGNGWGYGSQNPNAISRIDKVRLALAKILPRVTRLRRVGLITYGPGPWQQCNVQLNLRPVPNAAKRILETVNELTPAGQTPLSEAVAQAARVLEYRVKPGVIVLLTDGEETCGGSPCNLGKVLRKEGLRLTVHVIGLRVRGITWTGEQAVVETKCLAEATGGLFTAVETEAELVDALERTLGCPMMTKATSGRALGAKAGPKGGGVSGFSTNETISPRGIAEDFWAIEGVGRRCPARRDRSPSVKFCTTAVRRVVRTHVRSGSFADIRTRLRDDRFALTSSHRRLLH